MSDNVSEGKNPSKHSAGQVNGIVLDWRNLKCERQKRRKFKDYQEQLLREIPGAASRTNVAMHAVVDVAAEGSENKTRGMGTTSEIRNHALIHYIARLASSNNDEDEFDYSFVESLLENGADINAADKYGQTMFHEVARSWNVDVARFLLNKGANINQQDRYGRAPLHVAAAVDYTEMIEFLLKNKAQIDVTTFGELQRPIHFAAKNDACQALKLLLNYGASVNCRDYQNRTPVQVAASMSRSKAARYLVEFGAPTDVYDHNGEMTLSLLILKMPEVAVLALDQFRSHDMISRKEYFFLNYIEGPRIFEKDPRANKARSPLEVAVQYEHYGIVMHPVMKRLISTKWEQFGKKAARKDLVINIIFALVWTVLGITMPLHADKLYLPLHITWWRLLTATVCILLTGFEIFKQVRSLFYMNKAIRRWKNFREKALRNDKRFCHPKWRDENEYLDKEIKAANEERFLSRQDGWIFLDWTALLLIISGFASHVVFLVIGSKPSRDIHMRIVSFLLIALWVRLLKFTRPFEDPGPFVASISPMLKDFFKWSLLFCLVFIPYSAIFWMIFGPINEETAPSLSDIPGLLFTVFAMAAFSNLSTVDDLIAIDEGMARILTSTFVAVSTIVTLNLLIAMLADTFTRMYENSLETATMQRAKTILYLEQTLSSKDWQKYCDYIHNECSPEVATLSEDLAMGKRDKMRLKETLHRSVDEIHSLVCDRFSKRVGTEKSDMDQLLEGVARMNENISFILQQLNPRNGTEIAGKSGVLNLNIVLEHQGGQIVDWLRRSTDLKDSKERNEKEVNELEEPVSIFEEETERKCKCNQNTTINTPAKVSPSLSFEVCNNAAAETSDANRIARQLETLLNLIKDSVKKGKLNLKVNGEQISRECTQENVAEHSVEEMGSWTGDNDDVIDVHKDWEQYETPIDESEHMYPLCITEDGIGTFGAKNNDTVEEITHQSSSETTDQATLSNDSLSQSSEHAEYASSPLDDISSERRRTRYEGSSFLSSSSEGNTTSDDIGNETEDQHNYTLIVNKALENQQLEKKGDENSNGRYTPEEFSVPQFESGPLLNVDSDSHGTSSESVSNCRPLSLNFGAGQSGVAIISSSPSNDVSSSQSSDASNLGLNDDQVCSPKMGGGPESLIVFTPSGSGRKITPKVRWADTAGEPCATPFLNIREISASPSDNCSADNRMESD